MMTKTLQFPYLQIADGLERQILKGVLKTGDKLPSVRILCREKGLNMSTVTQAYVRKQGKGMLIC